MSTVTFDILARDHASSTFRRVGNETQSLSKHMDGLARTARRVVAAIGLVAIGHELAQFGTDSVKTYAAAQTAQNKLTDAYKRFPSLANVQIRALRQLNQALQDKTGTDHNALAAAEASLSQFNLTGAAIKKLTPLVNDYAVKTGQDVVTAATGVGRALLGNTRALKTIGINFKATGNQAKDAAALTGLLQAKLGGFATREGKTAAGQAKILSATFNDFKERVGRAMLPTLLKVADFLTHKVIPAMNATSRFIRTKVVPVFGLIGDWVKVHVFPVLQQLAGPIFDTLRSSFDAVAGTIRNNLDGFKTLGRVLQTVGKVLLVVFGAAVIAAIKEFMAELRFVLTELGLLGKAFHVLANFFSGPFLRAIGTLGSVFFKATKAIVDVWLSAVGFIISGAARAFGWVPGVGGKLKGAANAFNAFRTSVDGTLTGLANDSGALGAAGGAAYASGFMHAAAAGLAGNLNPNVAGGGTGGGSPAQTKQPKIKPPQFSYDPTALTLPATAAGAAAGKAAGNGVASGLSSTVSKVVAATKQIVDKINQQFKSLKDSAKQLAQSIADTMRATVDLTNISQTDSLGAAMAPTIANIKSYLSSQVKDDRTFRRLLKSEHARGLSTSLFRQLAQAGPAAAGGIVQALAGASNADLRRISNLSAQAGQIGRNFGGTVSHDVYGARLREAAHDARVANRLLAELVHATKHGQKMDPSSVRALGRVIGHELHQLVVVTDTTKTAQRHGHRVRAS